VADENATEPLPEFFAAGIFGKWGIFRRMTFS
jgi:hypothetical protein